MFLNVEADGLVQGMRKGTNAVAQFHREQGKAASAFQAGSKSASRFGLLAQQAGYQMQDFAVQVAGGQNALVAFSQQGSQMLGFFGAGGAIAGAALSVGILIARMAGLGTETKKTTNFAKESEEAWAKYAETVKKIRFGNLTTEGKEADINKQIQQTQAALQGPQALLSKLGEMQTIRATDAIGFMAKYKLSAESVLFPTLEQQLKYEEAVRKAREEGRSAPSFMNDEFGGGGVYAAANPFTAGGMIDSLISQAEAATGKYSEELVTLRDKLRDIREEQRKAFEDQRAANEWAAMSSTQQQENIRDRMAAMERAGQTETAEYEELKGQAEEYGRALSKITTENQRFGETGIERMRRLADEMANLNENTVEYQEKLKEGRNIFKSYEDKASTILDKQDPLRALKRSAEEIRDLLSLDLLNPEQAGRALEDLLQTPTLPSSTRIGGAMATGGFVGNADAAIQVQTQMLDVLKDQRTIQKQLLMTWGGLN